MAGLRIKEEGLVIGRGVCPRVLQVDRLWGADRGWRLGEVEGSGQISRRLVARGQRFQVPARLDEFEQRRRIVEVMINEAFAGIGRDDQQRHPPPWPPAVDHRRRHMVVPAAEVVVGDEDHAVLPVFREHDGLNQQDRVFLGLLKNGIAGVFVKGRGRFEDRHRVERAVDQGRHELFGVFESTRPGISGP